MRVFKNKSFDRFTKNEKIKDQDLREAVERANKGLISADLGGGLIKQRIARKGQGKSSGFRSIVSLNELCNCFQGSHGVLGYWGIGEILTPQLCYC